MISIIGTVTQAVAGTTKTGKDNYYVIMDNSSDRYYGFGTVPHGIAVGVKVKLDYEVNGTFKNVAMITPDALITDEERAVVEVESQSTQAPLPPASPPQSAVSQSVWDEKDRRIARQSSLKVAAEVLKAIGPEQVNELAKAKGVTIFTEEIAENFVEWIYRKQVKNEDTESPANDY